MPVPLTRLRFRPASSRLTLAPPDQNSILLKLRCNLGLGFSVITIRR